MQTMDEQPVPALPRQKAAGEVPTLPPAAAAWIREHTTDPGPDRMPAGYPAWPSRASSGPASRALDEPALRRPDFVADGAAIELSDGQTWTFPRPVLGDYYVALDREGKPALVQGYDLGPIYDELMERYIAADGPVEELPVLAHIAFELLRRNYAVEFSDMRSLLRIKAVGDPGREQNAAMWSAISDVAFGRSPKPTPAG